MMYADLMLAELLLLMVTSVALRLEVEPLGKGPQGVVVALAVQVAPEDREKLGERAEFSVELKVQGVPVDVGRGVVPLAADGSFLIYREWPVGNGQVTVGVASLSGEYRGSVAREVAIPPMEQPFTLETTASAEAVALLPATTPEETVRFLPPQAGTTVGTLVLRLEAPAQTSEVRFFQGEELLFVKNRPPWEANLSFGPSPARITVRAEAFGHGGRFLGEDLIVLNQPGDRLAVQILRRKGEKAEKNQRITVAVSPPGAEEEVVLKLDDRPVARWLACPCVAELSEEELADGRVLVAEAWGSGKRGEAVLLLGEGTLQETVRVEVVELPVTVLDRAGKVVSELALEDFEVFEDGRRVLPETLTPSEQQALSLGLAVDVSGSMQKDFALVRQAVSGFLGQFLRPGDRYFLGTFAWEFNLLLPWSFDPRLAQDKLSRVPVEGGTSLYDAVIKALQEFSGRKGPKGLVLLTDGEDTTSRTNWDATLRYARTLRTPIFPVGIRLSRLDFFLRGKLGELADSTGGEAFFVNDPADLPAVYKRIGEQLRGQLLLVYRSPSQGDANHFRTVTVKTRRPDLKVRTITGYFPAP